MAEADSRTSSASRCAAATSRCERAVSAASTRQRCVNAGSGSSASSLSAEREVIGGDRPAGGLYRRVRDGQVNLGPGRGASCRRTGPGRRADGHALIQPPRQGKRLRQQRIRRVPQPAGPGQGGSPPKRARGRGQRSAPQRIAPGFGEQPGGELLSPACRARSAARSRDAPVKPGRPAWTMASAACASSARTCGSRLSRIASRVSACRN